MSLDLIFAKEFKAMAQQRVAYSGAINLYDLPLPKDFRSGASSMKKVLLRGIREEYYSKLNNVECLHWTRPNLKRRKFGSDGQILTDSNGKAITVDVPLPNGCAAIATDVKLGVPLKFKSKEGFDYVDCITKPRPDGSVERKYIYIIPKKYCYSINQLALVLSLNKLRSFYFGQEMVLQSGHTVYLYVVPYRPGGNEKPYRVLCTKTRNAFGAEVDAIMRFWLQSNILFPLEMTQLSEPFKGEMNVGFRVLCSSLEEFVRYNPDKSLADNTEEFEFEE